MPKGGKRTGAGRPKGSHIYGKHETTSIRVPIAALQEIYEILSKNYISSGEPRWATKRGLHQR